MGKAEIHLERIAPAAAPGGIWIRICSYDRLLTEYALHAGADYQNSAAVDHEIADASRAGTVWIYSYDGDSGECISTLIADRTGSQN